MVRVSMRELIDEITHLTEGKVPTGHDLPYVHIVTTKNNEWIATFANLLEANSFANEHGYVSHGNQKA